MKGPLPRAARPVASRRFEVLIAALGLGLTALLVLFDLRLERERERREFERSAEDRVAAIYRTHEERIRNDRTVAELFAAPGGFSEAQFVRFAASHPPAFRRAIEFIPRVREAEKLPFEAELDKAHPGASGIWEMGPGESRRPAGPRSEYFPVRYMHPVADMEGVFGFDLASEASRRQALESAARSGQPTLSEPIRLVEDPSRWAYLRYVPLYEPERPAGTPEERREALRGFVVALYRMGDSLDATLESTGASRQVVYLYADDRPGSAPVHASTTPDAGPGAPKSPTLAEARALPGAYPLTHHSPDRDRDRIHVFVPWPRAPVWRLVDASTAIIALLGFALTAAAVIDRRRTRRAIAAADRNEERTRQILDAAPDAILVTDETGLIVRTNARTGEIFGYQEDELVGLPFETLVGERGGGGASRRLVFPRLAASGEGGPRPPELAGRRKDGTELPVEADIGSVRLEGRRFVVASIRDITEREAADERLRASEERFSKLFAANPVPIWLSRAGDGRLLDANDAFCDLTGYSRTELAGRTGAELGIFQDLGAAEGGPSPVPGEARGVDRRIRSRSGREADVLVDAHLVDLSGVPAVLAAARDVTDRRRQEWLRRTELAITRILSEASDMEEGVRRVLGAIGTRLGWEWGELSLVEGSGRTEGPVAAWHDGSTEMARFEQAAREAGPRERSAFVVRDPHLWQPVWAPEIASAATGLAAAAGRAGLRTGVSLPLFSESRLLGAISLASKALRPLEPDTVAMLTDVAAGVGQFVARSLAQAELQAERNSLARRVDERTAELRSANADLARSSRLKDEFLAAMSHELRTPLNAILGLSEALQEKVYGPLTESQERSLRTIEESGRHLLGLINDILDLSKIEAGKLELQAGPVDAASACWSALRLVEPSALKKGHAVSLSVEPPGLRAQADVRRLKQVLVNLLSNAVKFTDPGGRVAMEVTADEQWVTFTVRDTGIGISREDRPRLFKPFVQLDGSLGRRHGGSGLGLALVGRLVELHGGTVALESEPGRGTTVSVSVPRAGPLSPSRPSA